jgi:hypothetical protein
MKPHQRINEKKQRFSFLVVFSPHAVKNYPYIVSIKIIPLSLLQQNDKNESKHVPSSSFSYLRSGEMR